jgi:hypothetical protein
MNGRPSLSAKRDAFLELVDAGFVDIFDKDGTPLPNAKARRVLDKDAPWAENNPDSPNYFEVWGSDRGAEVLHAFELELGHVGAVKNRR